MIRDHEKPLRDRFNLLMRRYNDLLMCVEDNYEGETRHETAKRMIQERQNGVPVDSPMKVAS